MLVVRHTWGTTQDNAISLVEAISGWNDRNQILLDAHQQQLPSNVFEGEQLVPAVLILFGYAAACIPQWVIDYSVQLRQELQFGICEHETAGYYVKHALAELAREALPTPGYALRRFENGAAIFAPEPEIEAFRSAVCRFLWREMLFCKDPVQFETLARRFVPVANTENELAMCVAAFTLLGALPRELSEAMATVEQGSEFPSIDATAAILVQRFRPEIREHFA